MRIKLLCQRAQLISIRIVAWVVHKHFAVRSRSAAFVRETNIVTPGQWTKAAFRQPLLRLSVEPVVRSALIQMSTKRQVLILLVRLSLEEFVC